MNASAPLPNSKTAEQRAHEPSMEEILASIRRIIADDQVLPLRPRPSVAPPKPASNVAPMRSQTRDDEPSMSIDRAREEAMMRAKTNASLRPLPQAPEVRLDPETRTPAPGTDESFLAAVASVRGRPVDKPLHPESEEGGLRGSFGEESMNRRRHEAPHYQPRMEHVAAPRDEDREMHFHDREEDHEPTEEQGLLSPSVDASVSSSFQALATTMMAQNNDVIQEAIRDMLRPMLKQWLDDNLPSMVERLVRAEIERVARGGR